MARLLLPVLLAAATLLAYSSGPPNGKTGRPGEGTCADCHSGSGSGDSTILAGFPAGSYLPDSLHVLTLHVQYGAQRRWGVEITAVTGGNAPAGQFVVVDSVHTQYSTAGAFQYLKQTAAGTFAGSSSATWTIGWRAPAAGTGPVTFYWCCNAANNDGSTAGDFALAASRVVGEGSALAERNPQGRFLWRYANPARFKAVVDYEGVPGRPVRIYSSQGRLVRALVPVSAGNHLRLVWDGRDSEGGKVRAGSYFLRLGEEVSSVLKLELIR